jgi:DNA repair protein RadA/Sms
MVEQAPVATGVGSSPLSQRPTETVSLAEIAEAELVRLTSGIDEVDRVLGGGWVAGAVMLLAGEPGIGKSTLLLQLADKALASGHTTLYVAGEESLAQVKLRAERLGISSGLSLTRETDARVLAEHLVTAAPRLVIVDSVQTLVSDDTAAPGSLVSVRDATALLTQAAKRSGSTLVLIGHVTKQGSIAGPKVIEHVVDATLSLETASGFRVLRAIKNRFGPAGEMGVFAMTEGGMQAVANPSEAFLSERPQGVPGSVVVAALEGQRPLLLEVQALAAKSPYPSPRRIAQGLDQRRVDVVLAVLERRLELPLSGLDVYVNVAGGLRLTDPGVDLAVALAVYSAVVGRALPEGTATVGEVGLAGEVRSVTQLERRAQEATRAGFPRVIGPLEKYIHVDSLAAAIRAAWEG